MKKRKLNTLLILMIFFCLAFTVVLFGFESHHNKIKEQINDNKAKISLLEAENKELTQTISELETVNQDKLQELSLWQRQYEKIKALVQN